MKTQFPDDEIRSHDDRTGKYHNNILGGAVCEDDDFLPENEEGPETTEEDLDALATAHEAEAEALACLATANRTLWEAREKQHQVRQSRGYYPQQQPVEGRSASASSTVVRTGLHSAQESKGNPTITKDKQLHTHIVQRICHGCSQGQHWNRGRL